MPEVVAALDFALGLRSRGIAQGHAVEVKSLTQLGEGFRVVGVEKGVVIHVESQRQSVDLECAREEIEMSQKGFAVVEAGAGVITGGIV